MASMQDLLDGICTHARRAANPAHRTLHEGLARNAISQRGCDPEAEALLSKSVKLEPTNAAAWNALGECFAKKGEVKGARSCFANAVKNGAKRGDPARARALRCHSILLRKAAPGETHAELAQNTKEAIVRTKAAIACDMDDGESWYLLGHGYLKLFFAMTHHHNDLDRAQNAFRQGLTKARASLRAWCRRGGSSIVGGGGGGSTGGGAKTLAGAIGAGAGGALPEYVPDMYYNHGLIHRFLENWSDAAVSLRRGRALVPHIVDAAAAKQHLGWTESLDELERYVARTAELVNRRAKVKPKRLQKIAKALAKASVPKGVGSVELVPFGALGTGPKANVGKAVACRLLMPLNSSSFNVPTTFVFLDGAQGCAAVSVYSVSDAVFGRVRESDTVVLLHPELREVTYTARDGTVHAYRSVQLVNPAQFLVNGKVLRSVGAHAALATSS